ncbi:uncharacterized protein F4822DRAFT_416612 [Hypoxylon trugodes]|uniref:uncharacterized protein n=1 Tax=Hypoxylon trugodes TaxID=326681 RepID=UPI00219A750D|nr:uncharacterized protein F4822DRAFT_416612 [Hypoxylon trugodes]KAI1384886.1 hypothetical protein F4822DRAFT_416612 [Hypoxylon trugodes]
MAIIRDGSIRPIAVIIPLILSIAGFVLAMLALFAGSGSQQKALEDYHLIALNMSNFGHDLIPTSTSSGSQPTATDSDGFGWDDIENGLDDIEGEITDQLNDIANDVADKLSEKLGISQWYSIHIMTACEGNFAPNATSSGAWYNTTNCTAQSPGVNFNLTDILQREIDQGPLKINATDIPIPDKIREAINYLNSFLLATFVLYVLGSGFSGLSFLSCIVILTLRRDVIGRGTIIINIAVAALATLTLALSSAIATAISKKGVSEINDAGDDVGISAVEGTKFMTISWVAFAVMFVTMLFWCASCCLPRRRFGAVGAYGEKGPRGSTDSNRGLLGIFRRRR